MREHSFTDLDGIQTVKARVQARRTVYEIAPMQACLTRMSGLQVIGSFAKFTFLSPSVAESTLDR